MANSKRKCKHCKEYALAETGFKAPIGWFCGKEHAMLFIKDKQLKQRKKAVNAKVKADKKDLRERKLAIKPKSKWLSEAQASVNKYIRIRDQEKPCISCGVDSVRSFNGYRGACGWDAGHYRSRGAAGHLRFNTFNINKQCVNCNRDKSGNVVDYRINLLKKIGVDRLDRLEMDNSIRGFDVEYLKRIKSIFERKHRLYLKLFRCG